VRASLAPLRVGGYRRLLGSYVINQLGDSIAIVALSVLVFDQSGSAMATAGLFLAAKFLPAFLSPVVVARVDQFRARWVLATIYASEAVVFAGLAYLVTHYSFAAVLALALVDGTLALTARALSRGAAAAVLEPAALLREGNALMNVGFGVAIVVGTLVGGVIVAELGADTGLAIDAGSFLLVAAIMSRLTAIPEDHSAAEPLLDRLRAGLRHVRTHPALPLLLTGQAIALMLFYLVIPIEVVYAKRTLGVGDAGFGLLLGSWSAGILVGSLLYVRLVAVGAVALLASSTLAIGLAYAGMAFADSLTVACVLSVVGGVGNGFQWVSVMTTLQEATPKALQARVVGLLESIGAAMPGIGFLLGGALTSLWSPRVAYGVAGFGVVLVALAALTILPRRFTEAAREGAPLRL
jgi:MFS family permease